MRKCGNCSVCVGRKICDPWEKMIARLEASQHYIRPYRRAVSGPGHRRLWHQPFHFDHVHDGEAGTSGADFNFNTLSLDRLRQHGVDDLLHDYGARELIGIFNGRHLDHVGNG